MTDGIEAARYAFESPDEAGYPDGKTTLSQDQIVFIDEVLDDPQARAFDFAVVNDEKAAELTLAHILPVLVPPRDAQASPHLGERTT